MSPTEYKNRLQLHDCEDTGILMSSNLLHDSWAKKEKKQMHGRNWKPEFQEFFLSACCADRLMNDHM